MITPILQALGITAEDVSRGDIDRAVTILRDTL